jgi:MYXO-CTERM domain-containing protein
MNSGAFRHTRLAVVGLLVGIMTLIAMSGVLAQAPGTQPGGPLQTSTPAESPRTGPMDNRDDSSGEWGLVGLVGLLGLAGLIRRDRTLPLERTRERVGRP